MSWLAALLMLLTCGVYAQTVDFGDHSLLPSASSTANSTLRLGATVDAENTATTNPTATGDDTIGTDDEDGVTLPASIGQGGAGSMTINITNTRGSSAYLNVWIDWNNNGVLTDSGEQVATNTAIVNGTSNSNRTLSFTAPAGASVGSVGVRVRLTSVTSPGADGADGVGEVEDHLLNVAAGFALVVVNYNNNTISRFNGADGALLTTWTPTGLSAPNYGYRLSDNTLLVANGSANTITKYNPFTGALISTLVASGSGLNFPYQMAVGQDGSIYIANQNAGNVLRFNQTTGAVLGTVLTTTNPAGFLFDTAGQMYVTQNTSGGTLRLYNSAAVFQSTVATWPVGESPRGLAWGPDERLYVNVSYTGGGRVDAITFPARTRSTFVTLDSGSNPYTGIKWGPDGNLYVVDYGENEMHVYSSSGVLVRTITSSLSGPHAVAFTDLTANTQDYGDYTSFASASSTATTTVRLGNESDTETISRNTATANGDDIDDIDDEDGVTPPAGLVAGSTGSVTIKLLNTSGAAAYLSGWIDFNNNGVLTDSGEQIIANQTVATGTNGTSLAYTFSIPAGATVGTVGARFRLCSTSGVGPTGSAGNGEVEDYLFTIGAATTDFGDYSVFGSASSNANSTLRLGALVDTEASATTNATAAGDDNTGSDDEDGVTVPTSMMQGAASSLTAVVTNTIGTTAYLNVWIDFNRNGVLTDSGEQVAANTVISTGTSAANRTVSFTVPSGASLGTAGVRVRLTSTVSPGSTGASGNGEVEDYVVTLAPSLGIGNLVWNDANENGLFDPEESGINNVLVELWTPGADNAIGGTGGNADTRVTSMNTAGGGLYNFSGLPAGYYFVKVPTPPLSRTSIVSDPTDNGQDGDNNASQPGGSATAAFSPVIQLTAGTEPGSTGTGNIDNTVDFGFASNIGSPFVCDNRFYIMQNAETSPGSNVWDATLYYIGPGQTLVPIFIFTGYKLNGLAAYGGYLYCVDQNGSNLYRINSQGVLVDMGIIAGLPNPGSTAQWSGATALTNGRMILNLWNINQATTALYTIDLASATLIGSGVNLTYSTGGNMSGNMGDIVWDPLTNRVYGYNTIDTSNLGLFEINLTTGVCTRVAAAVPGAWGSMVIDANGLAYGYGSAGASGSQDTLYVFNRTNGVLNGSITAVGTGPAVSNSDGAACPGAPPSMKIGNLVWNDVNNNGLKDTGENGIDGVSVQLFLGGQNPLTATAAATVTTAGGGLFTFNNLSPGQYFLYIPTPPTAFPLSSAGTDTADNAQDNDDNGIQTAQGQSVRSPLVALTAGTEPTNDGDTDFNTDLTVDFGFLACPAITVNPASTTAATVGSAFTQTFSATGGTSPYVWAVSSGALLAGLSLNTSTGVVSGTPTSGAAASFTLRATDALGCTGTRPYTLTPACLPITVSPASAIQGLAGASYTQTLTASGGLSPYSAWTVTSGTLPAGLTLNSSTGVISGTPTTATGPTVNVTVSVTDSYGCQGSQVVAIKICPAIAISPTTLANGTVGSPYSQAVTASGGASPYIYSVWSGSLPAGLSLEPSTGIISGTPTSTATAAFIVSATDANACLSTRSFSITPAPNTDFGDFSTFASASNTNNGTLRMGSSVDYEVAQTTNVTATGDDTTGADDEDGVTVPTSITAGASVTLPVVVSNSTGAAASLNAWIDFNNNGSLADAGEQIATNVSIANGASSATQNVTFTVPVGASVGTGRGLRFRLTSTASPGATGVGGLGEVEDYVVTITAPTEDFGDFDLFPLASSIGNAALRLGASMDVEGAQTTNATATGDDITGTDDENGVTVPATITQGTAGSLTVNVTNTLGAIAYMNAWIDFNGNGVLTDAGEQIAINTSVNTGTSNTNLTVNFTTAALVKVGTVGVRVRLTSVLSPGPDGSDGTGEVEDYTTSIVANTDFGDQSSLPSASSRSNSTLRFGALVDSEGAPVTNAAATGDDLDGSDDEDGVTVPASIAQGAAGSITVNVTNTSGAAAFLNAWIDFNRNGALTDAGEQIAVNTSIATGTSNASSTITFTAPVAASLGTAAVRVRITSITTPGPDGLDGNGEVEDYVTEIVVPTTDFGDELDFADASSTANSALRLGALVDAEGSSTRNAAASGDDTTGSDDEDALTFPSVTAGQPVTLPVTVTNTTGAAAFLNAWIDYNNNGVLTDAGEQIATNVSVVTGTSNGTINLDFTIPTNAVTAAASLGTRFRLTSTASPGPTGNVGTGEVEDHPVVILAPLTDFGDHSGYADVSNTASSNLRLGLLVDTEYASTRNATATGDDITGNDDEDGVTLPAMTAGAPATMPVTVTNATGAIGFLNAWIDYNNNGVFTDSGEQIATNTNVATGSTNLVSNISLTVPPTAVTGTNLGVRVRITALTSPGASGAGGVGEVEDYLVNIAAPTTDFGDFATFGSASSTQVSTIRLGALTDTEFVATTNVTATGDDTTGTDDEDAIVFPSMTAGAPVTIPVLVTNTSGAAANLNLWLDYNGNGVLTDAGEQVATNVSIPTGSNNITQNVSITVPATALTGVNLGARVRLTSTATPGATGASGNGEVEDYVVVIAAPTTDFGDFSGFADASQGANPALRLGANLDTEFVSTRNATATGDDTTGTDDEDGLTIPAMTAGQSITIPVTVTNNTGASGFLNVWIDFNNNSVLTDSGEQVATNLTVATGITNGVVNVTFTVPPAAVTGVAVGIRARFSAPSGLGPVGANSLAGEIEDYTVTIAAPTTDFGDFVSFGAASSLQVSTIRLGALTDTEFAATTNAAATGDDTTGSDDEDAVTMPVMTVSSAATIPVLVTNTSGAAVFLNAWIDYNNNGVLTDAGEQIATNVSIATGSNNITQNINVTVPAGAVTGANLGVRFRLTSTSAPGPASVSGNGEVEDYVVNIQAATNDFGDFASFGSASNAANTTLRLGALVDAEVTATTNATATGDDTTGTDDEDGVTLPAMTAGQTLTVPVVVTNTTGAAAFLNAWIDFNNNGVITDAGEQVITNVSVTTGSSGVTLNPSFSIPATATTAVNLGVRFRLSAVTAPGATGTLASLGEVEDYVVNIAAPTTDFGDFTTFGSASSTRNATLRLGALTDTEFVATTNTTATGDDTTGSDDEDGVTMPSLMAGAPATIPVLVTNTSGVPAFLNAWIDYNNNGVLTDAGEQIATNVSIATGSNNLTQNLSITVAATAVQGTSLGVRFRLTSTSAPGTTGASGNGEVEDYVVTITTPPLDYGDSSVLGSASSNANSNLRLGALVDNEFAPTLNATASGDDITGSDDEDGVTLPIMTAGAPATIPVTVTNTSGAAAFLNAWIDFNNDGDVLDAEVEDYVTTIAVPTTDFGDWTGAADASSIASSNLRMGSLADTEFASTRNATATGDDVTGSDDEDGVTLAAGYNLGAASSMTVVVTNLSGALGYLNAWVDWNNNGSFADAGEQIATNTSLATGMNAQAQAVNFTVPAGAIPGQRGARIRLTSVQNPTPLGAAGTGEVEDYLLTVNCPTITLSPASLTTPTVGAPYSATLTASGGSGAYNYTVSSGILPAGLSLAASTGVISGTPTSSASQTFTITATDVNGCTGSSSYTVVPVCTTITIAPTSVAASTVGTAYSQTLTASGGTAPYGNWTVTSGSLPAGLTLNISTGAITGTPTSPASATFTVRTTDANGCTGSRTYTMVPVCPSIGITPVTAATGTVGTAYSQTLLATGGIAAYTWTTVTGTWPAGLALSSAGVISGTPTASTGAAVNITVRATDSRGCAGDQVVSLRICPVIALNPASLSNGTVASAYTQTVTASNGVAAYTYAVSGGSLPAGLTLTPSSGVISGTPTTAGSYVFTIRATDANGCSGTRAYSVVINAQPSIGNLVWNDLDEDGLKDTNEPGVANVFVELLTPGADNAVGGTSANADTVVATTSTNSLGNYEFALLQPGRYYVRITPPDTLPLASRVAVTTDNGVDNDNNGTPLSTNGGPVVSPVIQLTSGTEPGSTGTGTADNTIDFGLVIGNSVLWLIDEDHTLSTALHLWSFTNYRTPTTTATDYGRLKYRRPSDGVIRDIVDGGDIEAMAINRFTGEIYIFSSGRISGAPANTQSLWTYNLNDAPDNIGNIVLTLIGHIQMPTSGAFMEALAYDPDTKRLYTADPRDSSQNSSTTTDRLYYIDIRNLNPNPMLASSMISVGDMAGQSQVCRYTDGLEFSADGKLYAVDGTDDHVYEINRTTGAIAVVTDNSIVGGPGGTVDVETMAWDEVSNRMIAVDNSGQRFIEVTLNTNGGNIAIASFVTGVPGMPGTADLEASAMYDTYPPQPRVGVGNAVFIDANFNGRMDSGEGVNGVSVELYEVGDIPEVDAPTSIVTTAGGGLYSFNRLLQDDYFIHIRATNFQPGGPLNQYESIPGVTTSDDNLGEDGIDDANPALNGISSAVFTLAKNSEPTNTTGETGTNATSDDVDDDNTDLTIDFGFRDKRITLGDLVWNDANNDGLKGTTEVGIAGVTVQLLSPGVDNAIGGTGTSADTVVATTTTDSVGRYSFTVDVPGRYFVSVTPLAPNTLASSVVSTADNGVDNDNNGQQPGGSGSAVLSPVIQLAVGGEPGTGGATSIENTLDFGLRSCPVVTLNPTTLSAGTAGTSYTQALTASGGVSPYAYSVFTGTLPLGLTLNPTTGVISGTPTAGNGAGASVTIRATDALGCQGTRAYVLKICPVISVSPTALANGTVGTIYSQTLTASGGAASYSFTVSGGSLPAWATLNSSTGIISGTPNSTLAASFTITATDANGCQGTRTYSITPCPVITLTPATLPNAVVGTAYSQTVTASGSSSAYTYSVSSGSLPAWATLNASTGVISGTPTTTAGASFTLQATDALGCTGTQAYTITTVCPTITLNPASLSTGTLGLSYNQTLSATGGTAPYSSWTVASGTLPAGLTLNTSTGVLSGIPTATGSSTFTLRTTDFRGCQGNRSYTVIIKGLTLGNLIWQDNDNDGIRDVGEPGVAGAQVTLMSPGSDNAIGGTGTAADVQVGAVFTTSSTGLYSFSDLVPGIYFVRVVPPAAFTHTSGTPVTTDNNVDNNNDGSQPGGPGTPLFSPLVTLAAGTESTTDEDTDADTNLTLDFGLWAPLGVGNVVFIDLDGNGSFSFNEGIEGVYVYIFRQGANTATDEPVGIAVSDHKGRYFIDGLNPGTYFLHLPASQFATNGVLSGMIPMTSVVAGDDNSGQNLLSSATPSTTGASTADFTLAPGSEPTGTAESGFEGLVDDAFIDSNYDFTLDLGLRSPSGTGYPLAERERNTTMTVATTAATTSSPSGSTSAPATFASWTQAHADSEDGDLYPNLLEYALDTNPDDGRSGAGTVTLETTPLGAIEAVFSRPANGRADIRYELETSPDAKTWTQVGVTPKMSIGSDGRQRVRYSSLEAEASQDRALFRLKVVLDSNLDGKAEQTAYSPTLMFSRETFPIGRRTFSMPLVKAELFAGIITQENDSILLPEAIDLPANGELYVEDLATGNTYEIEEKASTGTRLKLETTLPTLTRIALRSHQTLGDLLPGDLFAQDDRVLTFDPTANDFTAIDLTDSGWSSNPALPKQTGVLVQVRSSEVTVIVTGQVSQKSNIKPANTTRLLSSASVLAESPFSLGLTSDNGFRAAVEPTNASRIRLWKGDNDATQTGYDQLFLSPIMWLRESDTSAQNFNEVRLMEPFRAFFVVP